MLLKELLEGVSTVELREEYFSINVLHLTHKSGECKEGSLFFAIRGENNDGANYVSDVEANGAVCVVAECALKCSIPVVVVPSVRSAMAVISANFYYNAHKKLKIIGITGTNGKTTTTKMIGDVLKAQGKSVATIGTLGVFMNGRKIETSLTTPDPIELHRFFEIASLSGVEYVVMEVSAHALALEKLVGVRFEVVALTNFTQDHLDFFGDMGSYKKAKLTLFSKEFSAFQVLPSDDELGIEIMKTTHVPFATYGIRNPADVFAIDYETASGIRAVINCFDDIFELYTPFSGDFNLYNALTAITVLRLLSVKTSVITEAFFRMEEVEGRFNLLGNEKKVIIDFAHTPDGLINLLDAARRLTEGRLIVVFGCGGNRDRLKRRIMGRIAAEKADFTVITSDNPRFEAPERIASEIEAGHKEVSGNYITILDRAHAINYAVTTARRGDLVVVAGKGAESYLEVKGERIPYSDRATVQEVLNRWNNG